MNEPRSSSWFACPRPVDNPRLRLFCFPHAGGGPSLFRPWADLLPEDIDLWALRLPGRGSRINEAPYTRLSPLMADLQPAIRPLLDVPFAFLGHSLGALLAFELIRCLRLNGRQPRHLFVSSCPAPHLLPLGHTLHTLPREEFIALLEKLNGTPPEVLADEELLDLVLPTVRADLAIIETYEYQEAPPLSCPITALGGRDDIGISGEQLQAWHAHTRAAFHLRLFAGGHFYLQDPSDELLAAIRQALDLTELEGQPASTNI